MPCAQNQARPCDQGATAHSWGLRWLSSPEVQHAGGRLIASCACAGLGGLPEGAYVVLRDTC